MKAASRAHLAATMVFIASVLLISSEAPPWCVVIALTCAAWRVAIAVGWLPLPKPRTWLRYAVAAITVALVLAVVANFHTLNGLAAGTALLVLMGALKLVEARTARDDGIVVGVALFMLLAAALADQSLWRLPLYLSIAWGACAAFALIAHPGESLATRTALKLSARALVMALPLAAACFVFFPRVGGQFWALQRGEQARTGLTDELKPGDLGSIANEYDPAFRVRFEDARPPREQLYFRGPVLNSFDGYTWRRNRGHYYPAPAIDFVGPPVRYRVTLEPTNRPYVITLDTVARPPRRGMYLAHDRQVTTLEDITGVLGYDAESYLSTRSTGTLGTLGRRYETEILGESNPRARALAAGLWTQSTGDADYARRVLDWFSTQGLEYTLDPGKTTLDSVDSTLFDLKRGFCAHFASAYAMLMRSAGVPARVVTGYLGGEWNPMGNYLVVRQSDAHAWTEIWLEGRGWTRVDPTAVVAPERLQRGLYDLLSDAMPTGARLQRSRWFSGLVQTWDTMNQWWQERVVEFDVRSQLSFLRRLGIESPDWRHLGWGFAVALLAWVAWVALTFRRSVARVRPDRVGRAWLALNRKLARIAPARAADEGPLSYAARLGAARPDLAPQVTELAQRYVQLRFGPPESAPDVAALERDIRRLTIRG